jgi:hypothetical protein
MTDSIGVRPKSTYVEHGGIRGIPTNKGGTPGQGYSKYKNPSVEIYAERWEQGLDIWTGEPLEGDGLEDWKNQRKRRNKLE